LFNQAAEAGENFGYYMMGRIYEVGYGVKRNKEKAAQLYKVAADMGYAPATTKVKELASILSNPLVQMGVEFAKDQVKDYLSDIVSDAIDNILDENGSVIADIVGGAVADAIISGFDFD
jgi:TPR repeat protein